MDSYRWLNEEEGGINGIKVELLWNDTGYQLPRAITAYKKTRDAGAVIMSGQASHEAEGVRAMLEMDKIPLINAVASPRTLASTEWIFTIEQLPAADQFAGFAEWLKRVWKEPRPVNIVIFGTDNEMGRSPIVAARHYERAGLMKVVGEEYFSPVAIDFTTQAIRIRDLKPDWIYIQASVPNAGPIIRELGKLGVKVNVCAAPTTSIDAFRRIGGPLAEGVCWPLQSAHIEEDFPAVSLLNKMHMKYRNSPAETEYIWGWVKHRVIIESLKRAVQKVGYDRLNGEAVREAILSIKDLDMMGAIPPVSFSKEDPRGMKSIKMFQVRGGKAVPISDWIFAPFIKE
jgi:branched-chain amino acid transport system substrate-binding protein